MLKVIAASWVKMRNRERVRTLNAYEEVMRSLIQQYRGWVVDTPGDNVLAEFASVVEKVGLP